MPVHEDGKPDPVGLQLWVDLPKQVRTSLHSSPTLQLNPYQAQNG